MGLVLVTGANGFVGHALCAELVKQGLGVRAVVRSRSGFSLVACERVNVPNIAADTDWADVLRGVETVIHLAARVHVMRDDSANPLEKFRKVNVAGTVQLAREAAASGVKRFVFLSSVKVNGEFTQTGQAFTEADGPGPQDAYAISKHEAELGLRQLGEATGMEVVIIRPPLVYGPGVKANFLTMMRWLERGIPLPLGAIHNKRSFVALDNLVDLIAKCLDHPAAANQTFLVSDDEDMSTTQLLQRMGDALGKPACLMPVPVWILEAGAALLGKRSLAQRLCGNLQVDISKARSLLGWAPSISINEGLRRTAAGWRNAGI